MLKNSGKLLMFIMLACLMLVVFVPMVFKIIEKTQRRAFAKSISEYISLVETGFATENIKCYQGEKLIPATFLGSGTFYIPITSSKTKVAPKNYDLDNSLSFFEKIPDQKGTETANDMAMANASYLISKNGKSPYGGEIYGYIKIVRVGYDIKYYVKIVDEKGNGNPKEESQKEANLIDSIKKGKLETSYGPEGQAINVCKFSDY